jgi:hypothetical protein
MKAADGRAVDFPGFDGNQESRLRVYACHMAAWDRPLRLSRRQFDEILAERAKPIDLAAAIGR